MWDEIIHPSPSFNSATDNFLEWTQVTHRTLYIIVVITLRLNVLDKQLSLLYIMYDESLVFIPKIYRLHYWSLGMDKLFHPTLYAIITIIIFCLLFLLCFSLHDDVMKWKHFPRYWPLCGNSPVTGEFPAQRPVTVSFDVFFDLHLNKRLSKQSQGRWFETPSHPLWRHRNALSIIFI